MSAGRFRTTIVRAAAAVLVASLSFNSCSATILVSDGFGDGDRDNNGVDSGATATDPSDVGIPWLLTDGTSAVTFAAIDDSSGIGSGNALQLFNTAGNNRPTVGHFTPTTMGDGDQLVLRLDLRLVSTSVAGDRVIRFGIYRDTNGDDGTVDHGSGSSVSVDDVGYNVRLDAGADGGTNMDVTRDDTPTGTSIIQATATTFGISSSAAANQLTIGAKHHLELTLTRSGSNMLVSLKKDSNAAISGTDTSPVGFTFDEIALGLRSNQNIDMRFDNIELEHIVAVPESATLGFLMIALGGMIVRRLR